jgi:hypothetical protein
MNIEVLSMGVKQSQNEDVHSPPSGAKTPPTHLHGVVLNCALGKFTVHVTGLYAVFPVFDIIKLRGFGPLANYADRATAASWRSSANFCG